jgi:hypothetical protein
VGAGQGEGDVGCYGYAGQAMRCQAKGGLVQRFDVLVFMPTYHNQVGADRVGACFHCFWGGRAEESWCRDSVCTWSRWAAGRSCML